MICFFMKSKKFFLRFRVNGVKGVRHKLDQPLQQEDHEDNGDNGGPKTRQAFLFETHVEESWGLFCK